MTKYRVVPSPYDQRRLHFLEMTLFLFFFGILARLFYWQVLRKDALQATAESQYMMKKTFSGNRGSIYSSDQYILATNIDVYTLFAEPKVLTEAGSNVQSVAKQVAPLLAQLSIREEATIGADVATMNLEEFEKQWQETIEKRLTSGAQWVSIKKNIPKEIKEQITALQIKGLGFEQTEQRFYPEASMSAQVLGFVGSNAQGEEQGYFGIEGYFDRELRGRSGFQTQERDARGVPIALGNLARLDARNGRDIVLTIRRDLQFMLEEKLKKGMEKYGSKTAEAVIMDPKTGRILAMASFPSYDPAWYYKYDPQLYKHPLVADLYEPGSTMKIFTVASGVNENVVHAETECDSCAGPRVISGYTIKTWNDEYTPNTTIQNGLVHSDNTAMIFIAEKLGATQFVSYLQRFHVNEKTGIEMQEEAVSPFRDNWREIDVATASFGQGIAVNGMQMVQIAQIIANRGVMVRPTLIEKVIDEDRTIEQSAKVAEQVISKDAAEEVIMMMRAAVAYGDAKWAVPKGYDIAGKTGTAQIPVSGHYDEEKTIASFIGFAPANDPQFVMLVKLREPSSSQWGSETAAPLWFDIAKELFIRMGIAPNN